MTTQKIVALAGSPLKGGNTDMLLESFIKGFEESGGIAEKVYVYDLKIEPCDCCGHCEKTGECHIDDDMRTIYPKLLGTERLVLASPIYFMGLPSQVKALIDRCQCLWVEKFLLKKRKAAENRKGFFISVGATDYPHLFNGPIVTVKAFFATIDIEYAEGLVFSKIDGKGAVFKHPTAIKDAYEAGKKLIH